MTSIAVSTIMGLWKANAQGLSTIEGLTVQIQNGKRVIVWPQHMAEAKYGSGPEYSDVLRLSELENVYMKLSGLNHYADDEPLYESVIPFSKWVADAFGPDRMVWGSGTPKIVDTHLAHWSESDRAKVKGGNLQRLLGF